ncbi:MAG TPA: PEGA domain-containing protein [Candidatus Saccharimonadales bacterium]
MMKKSTIIVIITIVGAALLAVISWQLYQTSKMGTLTLTVTPKDAIVRIDGRQVATWESTRLTPGSHKLEISRDDFVTQAFTVEVAGGKTTTKEITLQANSDKAAADWQSQHQAESLRGEAEAGKAITEGGAKVTADNPILNRLPYATSTFRIDFGVSEKHPNDPNAVALYITADGEAGKSHALAWMRSQGYDPSSLEIIYKQGGFGD